MKTQLPIAAIVAEALALVGFHWRKLLKVGFPVFLVLALPMILEPTLTSGEFTRSGFGVDEILSLVESYARGSGLSLLWFIVFCISVAIAVVGCHRVFLLPESVTKETTLFGWGSNVIKYIGWSISIGVCILLLAIPIVFIHSVILENLLSDNDLYQQYSKHLLWPVSLLICYMMSRWSLVLPACAIGIHKKDLSWSWRQTSGYGWKLVVLIYVIPMLSTLLYEAIPYVDSLLMDLLFTAIWLVLGAVEVCLISLSYKNLSEQEEYFPVIPVGNSGVSVFRSRVSP